MTRTPSRRHGLLLSLAVLALTVTSSCTSSNGASGNSGGPQTSEGITLKAGVAEYFRAEVFSTPTVLEGETHLVELYSASFSPDALIPSSSGGGAMDRYTPPPGMELPKVSLRYYGLGQGGEAEASLVVHAEGMDEVELDQSADEQVDGYLVAVPEGADTSLELVESVTRLPLNGQEGMDVTGEPLVVNQSFDLRTGELGSDAIDFYQEVTDNDRWTHDNPTKALDCTVVDSEYKDDCRVSVQLSDASVSRFSWDGGGSWSVGDEGSGTVAVRLLPSRSTTDLSSVPEGESLGTWTVELHTADGDLAAEPRTLDAESLTTSGLFIFNVDDLGDRRFVVQVEPSDQGSVRYEDDTKAEFELSFGD